MKKLSCLVLLLLTGCATSPALPPVKPETNIDIELGLLVECDTFSDLVPNPQPSDVLLQHGKDLKVLNACRERHSALVRVVRDAFNLPQTPKISAGEPNAIQQQPVLK